MTKEKKYLIAGLVALVVIIGGLFLLQKKSSVADNHLDSFTKCIADSGAKFYGAFWCPHCHAEKERFGDSAQYLPYVECSNPDGQSQNDTCNSLGIQSYPTWVFADGSTTTGEVELADLAEKTGCTLPSEDGDTVAPTSTSTGASSATASSTGTPASTTLKINL